jgi:hypothetical protein
VAAVGVSPPVWTIIKVGLTGSAVVLAAATAWLAVGTFDLRYVGVFMAMLLAFVALGVGATFFCVSSLQPAYRASSGTKRFISLV